MTDAIESVPMNDGRAIPPVGLGTYQLDRRTAYETTLVALAAGYRHVDTATIYGNEDAVGRAIRDSGIGRQEVFVTTKLWNSDHGGDRPLRAIEASLERLGTDYVDLWLMHWPVPARLASWRLMERARRDGLARSIGVSNFLTRHLAELLGTAEVVPAVNQIELSPFLYRTRRDTVDACRAAVVVVEAYSPLTKGHRLAHPTLLRVARDVDASPAQVLLRWCLRHKFVALPRSSDPDRVRANIALSHFTLTDAQMSELDDLDEGLTTGWDPESAR